MEAGGRDISGSIREAPSLTLVLNGANSPVCVAEGRVKAVPPLARRNGYCEGNKRDSRCIRTGSSGHIEMLKRRNDMWVLLVIAGWAISASVACGASSPRPTMTVYVGKHFEVRDHDQPTKYVFNGSTRVARIIGSLSTNTRIQRFRLRPGWNLLSLAVSAPDLSDQLQRPGVITSARAWNPQTGNYSLVSQVAPAGTVLWVHATTNATIAVTGTYSDPVNRQVSTGATYLPSTGLEAWKPNFPPSVAAWSFNPQPSPVRHSFSDGGTLNSQPTWLARLTGNLSSVNELPRAFAPGQALYVVNPAPFELEAPDPALRIRYYHQDHLGSSSVVTDADGAPVEETAFYPFGVPRHEHRPDQIEEAYKFTQKERDRESGLHYFEARLLTGGMARFMTQDPMYANPDALAAEDAAAFLATPQKMNMYAYARNNPLSYVDPTGLEEIIGPPIQDAPKSTFEKFAEKASTVVVNFCDKAFGCGQGSYQLNREILTQGYNVETDTTLAKVSAGAGFVTSLFVPVPPIMALFGKGAGKAAVGGGEAAVNTVVKAAPIKAAANPAVKLTLEEANFVKDLVATGAMEVKEAIRTVVGARASYQATGAAKGAVKKWENVK
jgi:RHS repeat-associated protein